MLRPPTLADVDGAAPYLADPEVMRFLGGETVPRADAGEGGAGVDRRVGGERRRHVHRRDARRRAARPRRDQRLGRSYLGADDVRSGGPDARPELAWALAREHWGFGYATEAAAAVRDWARRLEPLISLIAPDNVRSARVAERLGATRGEEVAGGRLVVWRHPSAR